MTTAPQPTDTVASLLSHDSSLEPGQAWKQVLKSDHAILQGLDKEEGGDYTTTGKWDVLRSIDNPGWYEGMIKRGRFPSRPSDLFLKCFAASLATLPNDPASGLCPPSLLGTAGVLPLTIISTIPDIMSHYHDVIAAAKHEVLLASNAWEVGSSVDAVTSALRKANERFAKEGGGKKLVVKILIDSASIKNAIHPRYLRKEDTWTKIGLPTKEELTNVDLEVMNYHLPPLGTFHSKFMVVDREVALVNSNNVNLRSNVEMCCRFEGDVVNGLYDAFLISWFKPLVPPPPCLSNPPPSVREYRFGAGALTGSSTLDADKSPDHKESEAKKDGPVGGRFKHDDADPAYLPSVSDVNKRLNAEKEAPPSSSLSDKDMADFAPFYFHSPHTPVPMALVSRPPHAMPGHGAKHLSTPQNGAWLAAIHLAQKELFIQSPVFSAKPAVEAVLDACKRGVCVTLFVDIGFNDFAEGTVPFQGGTNEEVCTKMLEELKKEEKEENLRFYWYTAKDQEAPLRFGTNQRNCHVKFMSVDGQISIMGSGNMDTQSWFHSQEVNVLIDSPMLVSEFKQIFERNQNTGKFGGIDSDGKLVSGKELPKKEGHGGLKRSQGGFL